ncbi:hypothetical protein BD309DRAFT_975562 [Dichomitus squalens]|uniref:Uncharacterized protein n=1 Tax=Dichomitus squalens TaxID=114155 RepID=A0A4Q9MWW2_9APHY|nr:hypothetical protein BD311DRAFT_751889 [Dichomitus squalens]TBU36555.1 hypothetical protein BD309DRAFT_975562 [Dichomitus squalens]
MTSLALALRRNSARWRFDVTTTWSTSYGLRLLRTLLTNRRYPVDSLAYWYQPAHAGRDCSLDRTYRGAACEHCGSFFRSRQMCHHYP